MANEVKRSQIESTKLLRLLSGRGEKTTKKQADLTVTSLYEHMRGNSEFFHSGLRGPLPVLVERNRGSHFIFVCNICGCQLCSRTPYHNSGVSGSGDTENSILTDHLYQTWPMPLGNS